MDCASREDIPGSHQDGRDTPCAQFDCFGPLVLADPEFLRKAALRIFPYFAATTVIAIAQRTPGDPNRFKICRQVNGERPEPRTVNAERNRRHLRCTPNKIL